MNEHILSANPQPDLKEIDDKLALFMDKDTLQMTIDHCVMKGIAIPEVRKFTEPEFRIQLAKLMLAGKYRIAPPHIVLIPKPDSAEMRKVYCNNPMDRVICTQLGSVYTRMYQDRIHPCCVSYQKGVGVPHIVRRISGYLATHPGLKGAKFDIHHYFDEISRKSLDQALRELDTGSCIDRIVWDYLHDDVILDEHGQVQRVYPACVHRQVEFLLQLSQGTQRHAQAMRICVHGTSVEAPPHQRIPVPQRSADAHGLSIPTPPALLDSWKESTVSSARQVRS